MNHSLLRAVQLGWMIPAIALTSACSHQDKEEPTRPLVWTSAAQPLAQQAARVFPALLQPRVESLIGFQAGGRVAQRLVEVGQHVRAGQTLGQLAQDDLMTGSQSVRQQVVAAEAELQQFRLDEARLARLSADGSVPSAELERQGTRVRAMQARLDALRQAEQLARNRVDHAQLKAPFDGVVTQVLADVGQVLPEGQPLLSLARAGEIEAEVFLPQELASSVAQTRAVLVIPGQPGLPAMPLEVREVSPVASGPAHQVRVRYTLKAMQDAWRSKMHWGQAAEVRWDISSPASTVAVPSGAVVKREGDAFVWRLSAHQDQVQRQQVVVQAYTTDGVIVTGIAAGTQVVSVGAHLLTDGAHVVARERTGTHLDLNTPRAGER